MADASGDYTEAGLIGRLNSRGGFAPGGGLPYANLPNATGGVIGIVITGTRAGADWQATVTRPLFGGYAALPVASYVVNSI